MSCSLSATRSSPTRWWRAHEEAVEAALGYLERDACRVRRGAHGVRKERAAGFVAAAYRHRMSRSQDPQLHTHVVVANMARGEDGRWTALNGQRIYEHAKAAGCLYEAHLRLAVIERLPWASWGIVREGIAELEQVHKAVREEFSQRRRRILERERELEAAGVAVGRAGRERIVFDTREPKREVLEEEWRIEVRARAAEHGLGQREFEQLMRLGLTREPDRVSERELAERLFLATGVTARRNTFQRRDLLIALASEHAQGASVAELTALAERMLANAEVVQLDRGVDPRFTTRELLAAEERIVAQAEQGLRAGVCVADGAALAAGVRGLPVRLSVEQEQVVAAIARSGNRIDVVEALAGTGKTTCAGALRAVYERAGYRVIGAAPTARAVRELRDRAGVGEARTLDGWAVRLASEPHALGADAARYRSGRRSTVLVIDEAGMASTRLAAEVIDRAMADGVKVVAIGDSGQLSSVQAGGWLGALTRRVGSLELREVMRQRDPHERRELADVHRGVPGGYLRLKKARGELIVCAGAEAELEAEQRLVAAWEAARERYGQVHAVMICRDNACRERLNDLARACLREQGKLGQPTAIMGKEWAVGDRVIARRNDHALDVDNGMRGTIVQLTERDGATVRLDAGDTRRLDPDYLSRHVEPAYAVTAHGMQGATVQWAGVIGHPQDFSRNWAYTALSRAREPVEVFLIDGPGRRELERAEIAPAERQADRTDTLDWMAARMRESDDEELALEQREPEPPIHGREPDHQRALSAGELSLLDRSEDREPQDAVSLARQRVYRIRRERDAIRERLQDPDTAVARSIERLREWMVGVENEQRFDARPRGWHDRKAHRERATRRRDRVAEWRAQEAELRQRVPDPEAVLERAEQAQREQDRLSQEAWRARDEAIEAELAGRPPWLEATLGPEPDDRHGKERWQETARQIAAHRIDHDVTDPHIAINEDGARLSLTRSIEKTRTALGLEIDDHGHEVDGYGF